MLIARVQVEDMATPVVALICDGAFYDVAALESAWRIEHDYPSADFHARVVSARCAGLAELDARLRAGPRPTEARIQAVDMLPLPPCDPTRAAYLQLGPGDPPTVRRGDSRAMVGDGQPVPLPHGAAPQVTFGIAVLVGEDLWRAGAREAQRAIVGVTLLIDWGVDAPSQLGPAIVVGPRPRDILDLDAAVRIDGKRRDAGRASKLPYRAAEAIAFVSQRTHLFAGDVIGLPSLPIGTLDVAHGARVGLELKPLMRLSGWATEAPPPRDWRI